MGDQISGALGNVTAAAQNSFGNAASSVKSFVSTSSAQILVVSVAACVIIVAIAYWIYSKLTTKYVNQMSYSVLATREGIVLNKATEAGDSKEIPDLTQNGQRATISFWLYIHNLNSDSKYKYVFRRAANAVDVGVGASPLAFFDADVPNKLHIRIPKINATPLSAPNTNRPSFAGTRQLWKQDRTVMKTKYTIDDELMGYTGELYASETATSPVDAKANPKRDVQGITIPYIPIQRWVHVAVVVNETINGGTITAYVDAEQVAQIKNAGTNFQLNNKGTVHLGDKNNGVEGLISYLTFHNFDLNSQDIYKEYRAGPIRSLLAKLGLPAYGVRSPLYPLSATNK